MVMSPVEATFTHSAYTDSAARKREYGEDASRRANRVLVPSWCQDTLTHHDP